MKPLPGDNDDVYIRPIPGSDFSIRIFGKYMEHTRRYGLDFVRTSTGRPENSPFEFELIAVPKQDSELYTLSELSWSRLYSAEHGMGEQNILPGEERWILPEGMTCLLRRRGYRNLYFEIPTRQHEITHRVRYEADVLDFSR